MHRRALKTKPAKIDYRDVLTAIDEQQKQALVKPGPTSVSGLRNLLLHLGRISLPHAAEAPNADYFAGTEWYWDNRYIILGLITKGQIQLAKGMVDNLCFLYDKLGVFPAHNSWTSLGRTQPPFLTSMVFDIYDHGGADKRWLNKVMSYALSEYKNVWMNEQRLDLATGLNHYNPKFFGDRLAVFESGWDLSSRFANHGAAIMPVDLACLLYKYEADFLRWSRITNDKISEHRWLKAIERRRKMIDRYFWDKKSGFYYDFDAENQQRLPLKTLAGFYPLWCGVASRSQARQCHKKLKLFEHAGGLANTERMAKFSGRQWDYPNGWPGTNYDVIEGLRRYGYRRDAERLTYKWLNCTQKVLRQNGQLWEKYDVVRCTVGLPGRYPTQSGFGSGWTGGVFLRLCAEMKV